MLVKFSKQIGNSFEETINTKVSSKPCQTSEMKFFLQVVTGFRGELRILQTSKMELFAKIVKLKAARFLCNKTPSWMSDKVLNMLLNWLPKLIQFLNQFKYQK